MTLEATLERIAVALEAMASSRVPLAPMAEASSAIQGEPEPTETKPRGRPKKDKASETGSSKGQSPAPAAASPSAPATSSASTDAGASTGTPSADGVRAALHKLQAATDVATVKALLNKFGGNTISSVDNGKWADLIAAAEAAAGGEESGETDPDLFD